MHLKNLRKLRAVASLLARSWDVVACIPDQAFSGFEIFTTSEKCRLSESDYPRHYKVPSCKPDPSESHMEGDGKLVRFHVKTLRSTMEEVTGEGAVRENW